MLLKDFKEKMIFPIKEILIDKIVKIRGFDVHIVSLTQEKNKNVLWVLYECNDELTDLEEREEYISNRDKMINSVNKHMKDINFYISELYIQNQKMTFIRSRGISLDDYHPDEGYSWLQHFIENGMSTDHWDEVNVSNIVIEAYEQKEDEKFPKIDLSRELDITITISEGFKEVLINQPIKLEFGEMQKGNELYFYDTIGNKKRTFYIDKMEHYDVWQDINKKLESQEFQNFSKNQMKQMKTDYLASIEEICPKGMDLAMLEYETEDGIQLNFYTKEYLDKKPVYKNYSGSLGFRLDKKIGINGFKNRLAMIKPIKKDFYNSIDVELFSWYLEIPKEVITL
ncbi:hypothetical protein PV797_15550 [Clostridiaceae bacterium M8S5]|nr:hypothetical protein PV797_15550 [Clostridiaceae bacterium M8S5]